MNGLPSPLVSLCIPTYKRARFLGRTIESALGQTLGDLELIVVDDASPDDTPDVVGRFRDARLRYIRNERNAGVPHNYNRVFSMARGKYVVLLEDHDILDRRYLERTVELLEQNPGLAFAFTAIDTIDQNDAPVARYVADLVEIIPGRHLLRLLLLRTTCPFSITTVIRRSLLSETDPPFDPRYEWYADINLWMRLAALGDVGYVASPLLKMRTRETGHYLDDKYWESHHCVDRIHRDNWGLLHPKPSVQDLVDRTAYAAVRTWMIARWKANRVFVRGQPWTDADRKHAARYLPPGGRQLVELVDMVPAGIGRAVSQAYVRRWKSEHAVSEPRSGTAI
jgi:glycosyltransferase involved in cell wall biosynthesis